MLVQGIFTMSTKTQLEINSIRVDLRGRTSSILLTVSENCAGMVHAVQPTYKSILETDKWLLHDLIWEQIFNTLSTNGGQGAQLKCAYLSCSPR